MADRAAVQSEEEEYVEGEDFTEDDEEFDEEDEEFEDGEEYDEEDEAEEVDGEIEEADDEEEDGEQRGATFIRGLEPLQPGGAAARGASAAAVRRLPVEVKDWTGLAEFPAATQASFNQLLGRLRMQNKSELTVLLLGKSGAGKSSTANSLFSERVANVTAFQSDTAKPTVVSRAAHGFTLTIIDTPGLLEADAVSEAALSAIAFELRGRTVDAVVYVDRLDCYRVEDSDHAALAGITRVLGDRIWQHTIIGLTRSQLTSPPPGTDYESFVDKRAGAIRQAIRSAGGKSAELPLVLIENSSRCRTNDAGEKVLPNGTLWLTAFMQQVVTLVTDGSGQGFRPDPHAQAKANPNRKLKWLIPVLLAAQIALKVFVLDRVLEEDGVTGDQYGPYDPSFVAEERDRLQQRKEAQKRRKEQEKRLQERKAAAAKAKLVTKAKAVAEAQSAESEEEESEEEESEEESDDE